MKKLFALIGIIAVVGAGGYYYYTSTRQTAPDSSNVSTGSTELDGQMLGGDAPVKKDINDSPYRATYKSWDELDEARTEEKEIFDVAEFPGKRLRLISAEKQQDGTYLAIFEEAPQNGAD
ncbi:hypothetical protein [Vagococcus acidifermentans]|uniref:Uncharacterized protein n=1 Tax=Vagococcus acidifermentans TaxID=564710 RepID=A0A430ARF5_9ENTE|nr:hypothetical protein [Vagococcus acidifermentans]RSU10636.1 hypothetical protein CBF27_09975 [Vagococcus acidifermentans]